MRAAVITKKPKSGVKSLDDVHPKHGLNLRVDFRAFCWVKTFFAIALTLNAHFANAADSPKELRIAVAANFKHTLEQLIPDFEQQHQVNIKISSAATGTLYQQILHGAPFDIFLSADSFRPQLLEQKGLIVDNSRQAYTIGQLAFYAPKKPAFKSSELTSFQGRLAIANPKTAPYGKAAKQVLAHYQQWPYPKQKLIIGTNISQTFQQLSSGTIDLGFIAYSQAVQVGIETQVQIINSEAYQPLLQELVVLKTSRNPLLAKTFSQYLMRESSQQKLASLGYAPLTTNTIDSADNDD